MFGSFWCLYLALLYSPVKYLTDAPTGEIYRKTMRKREIQEQVNRELLLMEHGAMFKTKMS